MNCEYCDFPVSYVRSVSTGTVIKEIYVCDKCDNSFEITKDIDENE